MSYAEARHIDPDAIPVIDMAGGLDGVPAAMLEAAERIGFFYARNAGVPQALIDSVFGVSHRFFAATEAQKQSVTVNAWHRGLLRPGQARMAGSAKVDLKESFVWGLDTTEGPEPVDGIPPNRWPDFLPELRPVLNDYFAAANAAGWRLLRAFAHSIGAPEDAFVRSISRPASRGSLIYYPPQPPEMGSDQFGVAPHTDYGCLTLLYQDDAGGLQVQAVDGGWVAAPPIAGTFVVNVGDLLSRWTNDRFRSTPHRVVNRSGRTRYSVGMFVDPNSDTLIEPVVPEGGTPRYAPVTAADYIRGRLNESFAYRQAAATA